MCVEHKKMSLYSCKSDFVQTDAVRICIRENILHGQRSARISKRFRNLSCAVSDERERARC